MLCKTLDKNIDFKECGNLYSNNIIKKIEILGMSYKVVNIKQKLQIFRTTYDAFSLVFRILQFNLNNFKYNSTNHFVVSIPGSGSKEFSQVGLLNHAITMTTGTPILMLPSILSFLLVSWRVS